MHEESKAQSGAFFCFFFRVQNMKVNLIKYEMRNRNTIFAFPGKIKEVKKWKCFERFFL